MSGNTKRGTLHVSAETLENLREIVNLLKSIDPYSSEESLASAATRAIACYRGGLEIELAAQKRHLERQRQQQLELEDRKENPNAEETAATEFDE
jgi:hypothetical protein